ncbi:uncharacterized protein LOC108625321 [Ceratina calcarata]|uniref:Uncharacterized protein LOC108625321 n=1 Tax=Ceratina calcarata TaxID=156304 RepID=A0AAJ7WAZ6_9HYME|nr:uncharacterized protein LOC108625321 [Ceratina calcarata]
MDSEVNGYAGNGTIKANEPIYNENSEVLNGKNSSSNPFCDFRDPTSKNNVSESGMSSQKVHIKDFPQLYVECDPNAWELPSSDPRNNSESPILKIKNKKEFKCVGTMTNSSGVRRSAKSTLAKGPQKQSHCAAILNLTNDESEKVVPD